MLSRLAGAEARFDLSLSPCCFVDCFPLASWVWGSIDTSMDASDS